MSTESKETIKTGATLIGVLVIVATFFFAAGNYPTRSEWDRARGKTSDQVQELNEAVNNMKIEQEKIRSSMKILGASQLRSEDVQTEIRKSLGVLETNILRRRKK